MFCLASLKYVICILHPWHDDIGVKCRLGSARAVNRRYISDCVPLNIRMQSSAAFVSASALGMACGPALAGLLQAKFKIYVITINADTLPGWVMALAWFAYLIWLLMSFKEPPRDIEENHSTQQTNTGNFLFLLRLQYLQETI